MEVRTRGSRRWLFSGGCRQCLLAVVASLPAASAGAVDCESFLKSFFAGREEPRLASIYVTMVTLNTQNTASYTETRLYYLPPIRIDGGYTRPGRYTTLRPLSTGIDQPKFDFGGDVQVFSDRVALDQPNVGLGLPHRGLQKFDERKADSLNFEIPVTNAPQVTITLRSWGDVKVKFAVTCEEGGFLLGSTRDARYVLRVQQWGLFP